MVAVFLPPAVVVFAEEERGSRSSHFPSRRDVLEIISPEPPDAAYLKRFGVSRPARGAKLAVGRNDEGRQRFMEGLGGCG